MTTFDEHERLIQISKDHLWLPFTQMKDYDRDPLIIESGRGIMLRDTEGKMYYDAFSSVWLNVHGHQNETLNAAIIEQLQHIAHSTMLGMANLPATKLAKRLVDLAPEGLERVFYSDSGATAVEIALKMAFQYWRNIGQPKKERFITMRNGYHGDTIGAISVGAVDLFHQMYGPLMFDSLKVDYPYVYRHASGDASICAADCLASLEATLAAHHEEVAALIVEPLVQGAGGMITMPKGFLKDLHTLCKAYDVLVIFDEVATGFGKTGEMFACQNEGVTPDILTSGKGLTGGYLPVAITMTTEEIYEAFYDDYEAKKTFFHGHSYTGNQLGCAVSLANLDLFEQNHIVPSVREKSVFLAEALQSLYDLPAVGDIRQCGFMVGIEIVKNKKTKTPYPDVERKGYEISLEMRRRGLLSRPMGDVLVFMPPLCSTEEDLSNMLAIMKESIDVSTGVRLF